MITQACAVKDLVSQAFMQPVFVTHTAAAVRSFTDAVNSSDKSNDIAKHPADMELYHIGSFDDSSGNFTPFTPVRLVRGADCVRSE